MSKKQESEDKMQNHTFRKETTFEGYFSSCWETSYLSNRYEISKRCEKWFKDNLRQIMKDKPSDTLLYFEDLIPKKVYERILENPKTKFRFKITVEVKEVENSGYRSKDKLFNIG